MVIDKGLGYEFSLDYDKLKQFDGKYFVIANCASFDLVPTVKTIEDDYYETVEKQCVESLHLVIAICDTESEALAYFKKCENKYEEWSTCEHYVEHFKYGY